MSWTAFRLAAGLVVIASPAAAQVEAPALAPRDGLSIDIPSPLEPPPQYPAQPRRPQTLSPVSPSSPTKTVLSLSAVFAEGSDAVTTGLRWRIFADQPDLNGTHALVAETTDPRPIITLDPGGYIVHLTYGLTGMTRHVVLGTESESEQIVLNAGALRFSGNIGATEIPPGELNFEIHRSDGTMEQLVGEVKAGQIVRLPAGAYQVTSTYGSANARIMSEIRVEPGKLTDAAVLHKAGRVDLRLVATGGAEVADASWSILTPGGDVVSEDVTAVSGIVLAEGEYIAVARHDGRIFQKPFEVRSGQTERIEVAAN